MKTPRCLLVGLLPIFSGASLQAQSFLTPSFSGTTSYDGWNSLNQTTFPGYGTYPGAGAWPAPIDSNASLSGDALLNKTSGNGYLAGSSANSYVYSPGNNPLDTSTNAVAAFSFNDTTAVAGLKNVLFQLQLEYYAPIGTGFAAGFLPTLSYNGGSQNLAATYSRNLGSTPINGAMGPSTADILGFQWNLNSIVTPITSFSINYSVTNHAQTHAGQLDQSTVFTQVVPEPATGAVLAGGMGLLLMLRRRPRHAV